MTSSQIFLSYRGRVSSPVAGRVYDRLATQFPTTEIVDTASATSSFDDADSLQQAASSSTLMLVLIDDRWLADPTTMRRWRSERLCALVWLCCQF